MWPSPCAWLASSASEELLKPILIHFASSNGLRHVFMGEHLQELQRQVTGPPSVGSALHLGSPCGHIPLGQWPPETRDLKLALPVLRRKRPRQPTTGHTPQRFLDVFQADLSGTLATSAAKSAEASQKLLLIHMDLHCLQQLMPMLISEVPPLPQCGHRLLASSWSFE